VTEILTFGSLIIAVSMMAAQWILGTTRKAWAWLCVAVVQVEYIAFGALTEQWGFVIGGAVFIVVNLRNYRRWRREEVNREPKLADVARHRRPLFRRSHSVLRVSRLGR
jgi:hypothetical protein